MGAIEASHLRLGRNGGLVAALVDLHERWSEPHRRYHALSHLESALAHVAEFALGERERDTVEWALWFHDAIYDATASDNEERSAQLAEQQLGGRLRASQVNEIARLVRLTAGHVVDPDDAIGGVMIDIDLSILGAAPPEYATYTAGVRAEYSHRSDDDFRAGRAQFLRAMLERARIFNTDHGVELWEQPARRNMAAELDALTT